MAKEEFNKYDKYIPVYASDKAKIQSFCAVVNIYTRVFIYLHYCLVLVGVEIGFYCRARIITYVYEQNAFSPISTENQPCCDVLRPCCVFF